MIPLSTTKEEASRLKSSPPKIPDCFCKKCLYLKTDCMCDSSIEEEEFSLFRPRKVKETTTEIIN